MTLTNILNQIRYARQTGRAMAAIDLIRRLAGSETVFGTMGQEVLGHALALGDEDGALEIAKAMGRQNPDDLSTKLTLAERYSRVGRSDIALDIVQDLKKTTLENPAMDYFEAVYAGHVGALDQSEKAARAALRQKPDLGDAWVILAATGRMQASDQTALESLVRNRHQAAWPGAAYALGTLYHGQNKYDQAWEAWTFANEFEQTKRPNKVASDIQALAQLRDTFSSLSPSHTALSAQEGPRPIFVVGAPRSGTTLTEQIIASDPRVHAMGETLFSRVATWPLGNLLGADIEKAQQASDKGVDWSGIGAVYKKLSSVRSQNAPFVTDKGAMLHYFVGALSRSLPEAKFVWVHRDKRDVFLSAYRSHFTGGASWRHRASDARAFLQAHDETMRFWHTLMPDRIHCVKYESLVHNPGEQIRQLMKFLNLSIPDIETLSFSGSTVSTASFAQVRGKISPKSVGGWQDYAAHIPSDF